MEAYMPCTGCGGPTPNSIDQGGKMIAALASVLGVEGEDGRDDEGIDDLIDDIVDPVGSFYKYGLPSALIKRKVIK
jgi:F420-non-reducing hydrogenase small subunit